MTSLSRRSLLGFLAAAPFIVKCGSLMPVRSFAVPPIGDGVGLLSVAHPNGPWRMLMTGYDELGGLVTEEIEIVEGGHNRSLRSYRSVDVLRCS